jgi:hypothetical protein
MKVLVTITIALLIVTKFLDVVSTAVRVRESHQETNPFAQNAMGSIGVSKTVWIVFGIALFIIVAAGTAAFLGPIGYQIAFVVVGIFISVVQAGVAACNWTGRDNAVSRRVLRFHGILGSLFYRD